MSETLQIMANQLVMSLAGKSDNDIEAMLIRQFQLLLALAKSGIVDATIECELDRDMNMLDMLAMLDRGFSLSVMSDEQSSTDCSEEHGHLTR